MANEHTGNPAHGSSRGRDDASPYIENVVMTRRVSKVVKGGRNIRFNAMVVVGDGNGSVGVALGRAGTVVNAIRKGSLQARKKMVKINRKDNTVPHEVTAKYLATKVLLKPAGAGTGIIAGGPARSVLEAAGISDILTKRFGSNNPINTIKATFKGLQMMIDTDAELARRRGSKKQGS